MPATPQDAQIIMQLYDLRRETEMRKARNYVGIEWWPNSYEDLEKSVFVPYTDENRYFRQAVSFWEMAATLVNHGTLNPELFVDTADEMFFIYAKMKPFIAEARQKNVAPTFMAQIEKLANSSPHAQEKANMVAARVERVKKVLAEKRAQSAKQG
jgi:hypothetical protein